MNNFSIKAIDSNQLFIAKYNLIPKISYLTLLYYQYVFIKETGTEEDILCSHFESSYNYPVIVITRYNKDKGQYILKRIKFNEDIYRCIKDIFPNDNNEIVINEQLLKSFNEIYNKTHKTCLEIEQK